MWVGDAMDPILALLLSGVDITQLLQAMNQRQRQQPSPAVRYPFNPPQLTRSPQEGGSGFGESAPGATKGTEESGKLSGQLGGIMGAFGKARSGVGIANTIASMLGASVPALSTFGMVTAPIGIMNTASALFGGPPEFDVRNTFGNVQDIADYAGQIAAAEETARQQSMIAQALALDETGYTAGMLSGRLGGVAAPSVSNPDAPEGGWGSMVGLGTSGGMNDTGGISGSGQGVGTSDASSPSSFARGGVAYANRPTRVRFGEPSTGGETAIFVPNRMSQPGLQGREAEVKNALLRAMLMLRGRR